MSSRYDPTKHHRRSIRLKGYDYSIPGAYFITALVKDRACILSEIHDGEITLTTLGEIVNHFWHDIPNRFPSVQLDVFVIMPNHIHGIIVLTDDVRSDSVGAGLAPALDVQDAAFAGDAASARDRATARVAPTMPVLGDVIGAFKSLCFTTWYDYVKQNDLNVVAKFWHRNYYEHIVRNECEQNHIREYIAANPSRWDYDTENINAQIANDAWLADEKIWFSKSNLKFSNA